MLFVCETRQRRNRVELAQTLDAKFSVIERCKERATIGQLPCVLRPKVRKSWTRRLVGRWLVQGVAAAHASIEKGETLLPGVAGRDIEQGEWARTAGPATQFHRAVMNRTPAPDGEPPVDRKVRCPHFPDAVTADDGLRPLEPVDEQEAIPQCSQQLIVAHHPVMPRQGFVRKAAFAAHSGEQRADQVYVDVTDKGDAEKQQDRPEVCPLRERDTR